MSLVATYEIEYLQYLGADGRLLGDELPEFARDRRALVELLKQMLYIRTFDTKAVALQRTGKLGTYASCLGHEAAHIGIGSAMQYDDVFAPFTAKEFAAERQLWLQPGEKMLFAGGASGLALDRERHALKVVDAGSPDVLVHDPTNRAVAYMLVEMPASGFPVALGVIYEDPAPTFDSAVITQNAEASKGKAVDLQALVSKGQTWMVDKEPRPE